MKKTPHIDAAVENQKERIARLCAAINALELIYSVLHKSGSLFYEQSLPDDVENAGKTLRTYMYKTVNKAWSDLAMFTKVSPTADKILQERVRTWFEKENHSIMEYLGQCDGHLVKDEEAFRKQVMSFFEK